VFLPYLALVHLPSISSGRQISLLKATVLHRPTTAEAKEVSGPLPFSCLPMCPTEKEEVGVSVAPPPGLRPPPDSASASSSSRLSQADDAWSFSIHPELSSIFQIYLQGFVRFLAEHGRLDLRKLAGR
jgi:hypothetical protein